MLLASGCITGDVARETTTTLSAEQMKNRDYRDCMNKCSEYSTCTRYLSEAECDHIKEDCRRCMDDIAAKYG
ncbi:MAG: hypothetical protein HZB66_01845 [Candidatus Aenigmarchaeota archaeon]|nr:hypothetical protein [Candidatus Aenigmarchaeota archaeon]